MGGDDLSGDVDVEEPIAVGRVGGHQRPLEETAPRTKRLLPRQMPAIGLESGRRPPARGSSRPDAVGRPGMRPVPCRLRPGSPAHRRDLPPGVPEKGPAPPISRARRSGPRCRPVRGAAAARASVRTTCSKAERMPDKDVLLLAETFPGLEEETTSSETQAAGEAPVRYPVDGATNETRRFSPLMGRACHPRRVTPEQTTAFVLGGGGILGAAEVGMLRALLEREIVPDLIVGSSVGALNGAFIAADPSTASVAAHGRSVDRPLRPGSVRRIGLRTTQHAGPSRDAPPRQRRTATIAQ